VDAAVDSGCVQLALACHAQAHAGHGFAPALWDGFAALFAIKQTFARGHVTAHTIQFILHSTVDLLLHRVFACPSFGHVRFLQTMPSSTVESAVYAVFCNRWPFFFRCTSNRDMAAGVMPG